MEGQEKIAKNINSLRLSEIITEDDTSGADELDKFSKLEMKMKAAMEEQFRNNSKQLDRIFHAINESSKFDLESQSNL
jgi:hypothetical protein